MNEERHSATKSEATSVMTTVQKGYRKRTVWLSKTGAAVVGAAAAAGLLSVTAFAQASPTLTHQGTVTNEPAVRINYFFNAIAVPNGETQWQWLNSPDSELFANSTSRAIVTGTVDLGSSNGASVSGDLGVCYQSGDGPIRFGNWQLMAFAAPAGQWVEQAMSGTILPGANNLPSGIYKVGLCVSDTSQNLVYDTTWGALTGTVMVAENSGW
jgi:hypothetical protein